MSVLEIFMNFLYEHVDLLRCNALWTSKAEDTNSVFIRNVNTYLEVSIYGITTQKTNLNITPLWER
jgi:hypothetical protein